MILCPAQSVKAVSYERTFLLVTVTLQMRYFFIPWIGESLAWLGFKNQPDCYSMSPVNTQCSNKMRIICLRVFLKSIFYFSCCRGNIWLWWMGIKQGSQDSKKDTSVSVYSTLERILTSFIAVLGSNLISHHYRNPWKFSKRSGNVRVSMSINLQMKCWCKDIFQALSGHETTVHTLRKKYANPTDAVSELLVCFRWKSITWSKEQIFFTKVTLGTRVTWKWSTGNGN